MRMEVDHPNLNRIASGWEAPKFQLTRLFLYYGQTSSFWGSSASVIRKISFCFWVPNTDTKFFSCLDCCHIILVCWYTHPSWPSSWDWPLLSDTEFCFILLSMSLQTARAWFHVPFISNVPQWASEQILCLMKLRRAHVLMCTEWSPRDS
jgi:hypothetical protein